MTYYNRLTAESQGVPLPAGVPAGIVAVPAVIFVSTPTSRGEGISVGFRIGEAVFVPPVERAVHLIGGLVAHLVTALGDMVAHEVAVFELGVGGAVEHAHRWFPCLSIYCIIT